MPIAGAMQCPAVLSNTFLAHRRGSESCPQPRCWWPRRQAKNALPYVQLHIRPMPRPASMAISSTSSARALGFATSVRLPRRRGAFSSCHAPNRKNSFQDRLVPQCRLAHRRPQDGCLQSQVQLRAPSLRRTCSAVEYCTCIMVVACASIRVAIIGLTSTCRPKAGRR